MHPKTLKQAANCINVQPDGVADLHQGEHVRQDTLPCSHDSAPPLQPLVARHLLYQLHQSQQTGQTSIAQPYVWLPAFMSCHLQTGLD